MATAPCEQLGVPGSGKPIEEVVVTLDRSALSARAIPVAAALARQAGAPLRLVTVQGYGRGHDTRYLAAVARGIDSGSTSVEVLTGVPAAGPIVRDLYRHPHALLVMSTHARPAVGELLLGSTAEEVVRRSPAPVVLVGPRCDRPEAGERYTDLLACVDDLPAGDRLLAVTRMLVHSLGVHPTILEVMEPRPSGFAATRAELTSNAHRLASTLRMERVAAGWEVAYDVLPDRAIVDMARALARPLIALATHGRPLAQRFGTTSTTVAVAHHATCPVVVTGPAARTR